jgi:hypothetical protein
LARILGASGSDAYTLSLNSAADSDSLLQQSRAERTIAAHVAKYVSRDTLDALAAREYEASMSEQELRDLLGFFTGPVGRKYFELQPKIFLTLRKASAALLADHDGQRMAALPGALAACALQDGTATARGALTAYGLLGAQALVAGVTAAGYWLVRQ